MMAIKIPTKLPDKKDILTLPGGTPVKKDTTVGPVRSLGPATPISEQDVQPFLDKYQKDLMDVKTPTPFLPGTTPTTQQGSRSLQPIGGGIPGEEVPISRTIGPVMPKGADLAPDFGTPGEPVYDPETGELIGTPVETGAVPTPTDLTDLFDFMREKYDLDTMEQNLNLLKSELRDAEARMRERSQEQEGGRVSLGVIAGRVSEIERQEMVRIDMLNRQIQRETDTINSAYGIIDTYVELENTDYTNAANAYQAAFENNMAINAAYRKAYESKRDFEQQLIERDQDMAVANLQIYADMIVSGSMTWTGMSSAQKTAIHKLEVKSGLGYGFISKLKMPPGSDIMSITNRTDQSGMQWADIVYVNPDGSTRVEHQKLGQEYIAPKSYGGGGTGTQKERDNALTSKYVTNVKKKGSTEREQAIAMVQSFDVDKRGPKTIIKSGDVDRAIDMFAASYGVDEPTAYYCIQEIIRSHHYTVT